MKSKNKKITLVVDVEVYEDSFGNEFVVSEENLLSVLNKEVVNTQLELKKKRDESESLNEFKSFVVSKDIIKGQYDERNPEEYAHFVHEFLKKYSSELDGNCQPFYNGGNHYYQDYNRASGKHKEMMSLEYGYSTTDGSVRDKILTHMLYFTGRFNGFGSQEIKTIGIRDEKHLCKFLDFILYSNMFDVNMFISITEDSETNDVFSPEYNFSKSEKTMNHNNYELTKYGTIGELIFQFCVMTMASEFKDPSLELRERVFRELFIKHDIDPNQFNRRILGLYVNIINDL